MAVYTRNSISQDNNSNLPAVRSSVDLSSVIISSFETVKETMEIANANPKNIPAEFSKNDPKKTSKELIPIDERKKFLDEIIKNNIDSNEEFQEKKIESEKKESEKERKRKELEAEKQRAAYEKMLGNVEKGLIDFAQNPLRGAAEAIDAGIIKLGGKTLSVLNTPIKDLAESAREKASKIPVIGKKFFSNKKPNENETPKKPKVTEVIKKNDVLEGELQNLIRRSSGNIVFKAPIIENASKEKNDKFNEILKKRNGGKADVSVAVIKEKTSKSVEKENDDNKKFFEKIFQHKEENTPAKTKKESRNAIIETKLDKLGNLQKKNDSEKKMPAKINKGGVKNEHEKNMALLIKNQKNGNNDLTKLTATSAASAKCSATIATIIGKISLVLLGLAALFVGIPILVANLGKFITKIPEFFRSAYAKLRATIEVLGENIIIGIERVLSKIPILKYSPLSGSVSVKQRKLAELTDYNKKIQEDARKQLQKNLEEDKDYKAAKKRNDFETMRRMEEEQFSDESIAEQQKLEGASLIGSYEATAKVRQSDIDEEIESYYEDEKAGKEHKWGKHYRDAKDKISSIEDLLEMKKFYEDVVEGKVYNVNEQGLIEMSESYKNESERLNKLVAEGLKFKGSDEVEKRASEYKVASMVQDKATSGTTAYTENLRRSMLSSEEQKRYDAYRTAEYKKAEAAGDEARMKNLTTLKENTWFEKKIEQGYEVQNKLINAIDKLREAFLGTDHYTNGKEITVETSTKDVQATAIKAS